MRYLIVSDIHSNSDALQAVLHHVRRKRYDQVIFLGDAVGYGAAPNQVLAWLRSLVDRAVMVRGNHDRVCAGLDSAEYFNHYAREASEWTHQHLEPRNLDFLRTMPAGPLAVSDQLLVCHGSPQDEDAYIFSAYDAQAALGGIGHQLALFGHTHVPSAFILDSNGSSPSLHVRLLTGRRNVLPIEPGCRYLINPGSVGQPRDRDPRASYAIFDDEQQRIYLYRVTYRVAAARRRIVQAGLPSILGDRLLYGA